MVITTSLLAGGFHFNANLVRHPPAFRGELWGTNRLKMCIKTVAIGDALDPHLLMHFDRYRIVFDGRVFLGNFTINRRRQTGGDVEMWT